MRGVIWGLVGVACAGVWAAGPAATAPVKGEEVLAFLSRVTDWYRRVEGAGEGEASREVVLRESVRGNARQVVGLAFDFARAEAVILEAQGPTTRASAGQRGTNLARVAASTEERVRKLEGQVDAATTRPTGERERLAAQLDLARAQRDVMRQYAEFVSAAEAGETAGSLAKRIDDLEQTVPEVRGGAKAPPQQGGAAAAAVGQEEFRPESAGVFALIGLCASVGLGFVATDRMFLHPGQRVFIQAAHRAASFGAVSFLIIHIVTEILAQRVHGRQPAGPQDEGDVVAHDAGLLREDGGGVGGGLGVGLLAHVGRA